MVSPLTSQAEDCVVNSVLWVNVEIQVCVCVPVHSFAGLGEA